MGTEPILYVGETVAVFGTIAVRFSAVFQSKAARAVKAARPTRAPTCLHSGIALFYMPQSLSTLGGKERFCVISVVFIVRAEIRHVRQLTICREFGNLRLLADAGSGTRRVRRPVIVLPVPPAPDRQPNPRTCHERASHACRRRGKHLQPRHSHPMNPAMISSPSARRFPPTSSTSQRSPSTRTASTSALRKTPIIPTLPSARPTSSVWRKARPLTGEASILNPTARRTPTLSPRCVVACVTAGCLRVTPLSAPVPSPSCASR